MNLLIKIENGVIRLILKKSGKILDGSSFADEHNLTEKLLVEIDELLKRNKVETRDVERISVKTDQGDSYTTSRIARAVAQTFNFAVSVDNKS